MGQKKAGSTDIVSGTPTSSPSRVKMRTRLSTGTLTMNGTSTVKEKSSRTPPLMPSSDSPKTWTDNLGAGSKRRASGSTVVPPKLRKVVRKEGQEEGDQKDEYCWLCHKDEVALSCHVCPRSFHLKCLNMTSVGKEWVCSECAKIMQEECKQSCSKAVSEIIIDKLCLLLRYALDRMRQPGSEIFQQPMVDWYTDYILHPMDFTMLEKNIKNKEYGCTDAFLSDAKWILHNCIIFNGVHHKLTNVARNVLKSCKHEMSEIDVCPQCYGYSCIYADGSWFVEPCDPPHTLVWAKLTGYPFWPAKVLQEVNGQVDVRFFGAHDMSWIPVSQVFLLSKESPTAAPKNKKGGFDAALEELKEHINLLKKKFGRYDYAPYRTPYDRQSVYRNNNLITANKRYKTTGFGKLAIRGKEVEKVSAVSKTASALKSKYNTMASKKSTSTQVQGYSHPGRPFSSIAPLTSSSCESSPEKPPSQPAVITGREGGGGFQAKQTARKSLKVLNPVVSIRDIIHSKILKQKELEEMDTDSNEDEKGDSGDAGKTFDRTVAAGKAEICLAQSANRELVASIKGVKVTSKALVGREAGAGIEGEVVNKEVGKVQQREGLATDGCWDSQSITGATKQSSSEPETSARHAEKGAQLGVEVRKPEETSRSTGVLPQQKISLLGPSAVPKSLGVPAVEKTTAPESKPLTENTKQKNMPVATATTTVDSSGKKAIIQPVSVIPACPTTPSSTDGSGDSQSIRGATKQSSSEPETSARHAEKGAQLGVEVRKPEETSKSTGVLPQRKISLLGTSAVPKSLGVPAVEKTTAPESKSLTENTKQKNMPAAATTEDSSGKKAIIQPVPVIPACPTTLSSTDGSGDSQSIRGATKQSSSEPETSARHAEKSPQLGVEVGKPEETSKSAGVLPQQKIGLLGPSAVPKSLGVPAVEKTTVSVSKSLTENAEQKNMPAAAAATTGDSSGKEASIQPVSVIPACLTTPSSSASASSVPMELSPKSGVEYKHALLKTIEACKGKLGISEVIDIEEINLDGSEDDDDDLEEDNSSDGREGKDAREGASRSTKTDEGSDPPPGGLEVAGSTPILTKTEQQPSTLPGQVSGLQPSPVVNVTGSEGKPGSLPKPACELGPYEKNLELPQPASDSSSSVTTAPVKDSFQKSVSLSSAVENPSSTGASHPLTVTPKPDSVALSSDPVSQSDSHPVTSKPVLQSGSHCATASPDLISQPSNQNTCSTTILLKTLKETTTPEKTDSMTTVSSSKPVSVVYTNQSATSKPGADKSSLLGNGATRVKPITIEDDDEEPGLAMEVEMEEEEDEDETEEEEEEDEDSLIIDLDEDDLDLTAGGSGSTRSDDYMQELAPSLSSVKNAQKRFQVNILRKSSKKQKNKPDSDKAAPASSSLSPTASALLLPKLLTTAPSSSSPSSASPAPCVVMDVRSLSGMDHDWQTSESLPQEQAHSQTLAKAPSQGQRQVQQSQELGQVSAELQVGQPKTGPYPSAYTFHFKRPAAPSVTPARPASTTSATSSTTSTTSTLTSSASSSRSSQRLRSGSSTEEGEGSEKPSLTAAAVSLVNKYSQQLISNTQIQLAEMCREMLASAPSEKENEQRLQAQRDQLQWIHEKQVAEIQHDFKMMIAEMKACWTAEKSKAISDLKNKLTKEKEDAVAETKKKQWCALCWKEALYYCCWNTTYCSYACQQNHWATHQDSCRQVADTTASTTAATTTEPATSIAEALTAATVSSTNSKEAESFSNSYGGLSLSEAEERIKDDSWRSQLSLPTQALGMGQSIHFLPTQPAQHSSQPLQQLQYLHSIGPTGPTTFHTNSQVQLLSQRQALNTMLPAGTVVPGNAMVFPILRNAQPATLQGQPNVILNRPVHYQPIWKNC